MDFTVIPKTNFYSSLLALLYPSQHLSFLLVLFIPFVQPNQVWVCELGLGLFLGTTWLDLGISTEISLWPESLADV